jgi:hypothetical protein
MAVLALALSMVVLLTALIVAFFAATGVNRTVEKASSNTVAARILAEGAVSAIQGEFLREIEALSSNRTIDGVKIYTPKTSADIVPQRAVSIDKNDSDFANLVKQSGQPFFTGGTPSIFSFTANTSTETAGPDGRKILPARWNAPMLTGKVFSAGPKWIYVNSAGYQSTTDATTIGRVAFNVYDVGGLLDANVAGFAPKSAGVDPSEMPTKGSAVWADLRAIPGINSAAYAANDAWPPRWRITGDWTTFTSDSSSSSLPYYLRSGWLEPFYPSDGTRADRMFASRQDLIRYAKANPTTFSTPGDIIPALQYRLIPALQYLTTFSRDRERPTFRPAPSRPTVAANLAAGGNDALGLDDQINPALVNQAKVGGSLAIKKRFSLSRLSLVSTPVPPAAPTGSASDILKYFGLAWSATNNQWVYDHGSANKILRLSEVPAGRDPDFFELLKAALSVGGLGKQFGFSFPETYADNKDIPSSSRLGGEDGRIEDQIVQIAANIIDQADPDSYPTRIQFNARTFYGIEDLPRIYRAHDTSYIVGKMGSKDATAGFGPRLLADSSSPILNDTYLYVTMVYPELWNPHRTSPTPTGVTPTNFRVVAKSFTSLGVESIHFWSNPWGGVSVKPGVLGDDSIYFSDFRNFPDGQPVPNGPNCSGRINYTAGEGASSADTDPAITFNLGAGDASFREPRPLSAVGYPAGSNANGSPNNPDMAVNSLVSPTTPDTVVTIAESAVPPPLHGGNNATYRNALGFVAGYSPCADNGTDPTKIGTFQWLKVMKGRGGPVAFELQYNDPSNPSIWWTMDKWEIAYANKLRYTHIQSHVATRADPRTTRWGSLYSIPAGFGDPNPYSQPATPYRYNTGLTANPSTGNFPDFLYYTVSKAPGWTGALAVNVGAQLGQLQANLISSPFRYTDPDGILRGGDARYASAASAPGWPMFTGNTDSRPVVLNRPFRSVAELGHVFRDTPWRNLDFMSPESADRALLDVFTVSEIPDDGIVAGRVNLNTRQAPVVAALIQNAGLATGANITAAEATAAASKLTQWTASTDAAKGPLSDRSELVGRFVSGTSFKGPLEDMANDLAATNRPIKASREAIAKALTDAGTTRSWNLLIDIIAQSGQVTPAGVFLPQGESRIWNSVAMDRFSAEVLEQFNETVPE